VQKPTRGELRKRHEARKAREGKKPAGRSKAEIGLNGGKYGDKKANITGSGIRGGGAWVRDVWECQITLGKTATPLDKGAEKLRRQTQDETGRRGGGSTEGEEKVRSWQRVSYEPGVG